jgi:hypothetical protein
VIEPVHVLVLTSNQFSRRWRDCNPNSPSLYTDTEDEDTWRTTTLELLSRAHTLGGITDLSFEVAPTDYAVSGVTQVIK